jgi:hypothetical protein
MVTGARLLVVPGAGARVVGIMPGASGRLAGPMMALGLGGASYEIPRVALPYIGHGLEPDLFDVGLLLRAQGAGRLPVTVAYRGGAPSLPGVTITHAAGGTAQGYLTAAGAAAFGAALARQFAADRARGSYGQDGMFAGGVSVGLAGAPARPARTARAFPMGTVTVTGTNLAGHPDTGDEVLLFNADNSTLVTDPFQGVNFFYKGVAKFSLPVGHYWAVGSFVVVKKPRFIDHAVIVPQFTLGKNAAVHMDARTADSLVSAVTPRPARPDDGNFQLLHPTPAGGADSLWWLALHSPFGFNQLYISPTTSKPTVGTLQAYSFQQLASPRGATGTPYQYNLAFADTGGLIPPQRHVVSPGSLATVRARYFSDAKTVGASSRYGVFPVQWATVPGVLFRPLTVPRQQTEYMTGNPAVLWADSYEQSIRNLAGGQADALRAFRAGQRLTENWNAYPLHAGYNTDLVGAANVNPAIPSAARAGDALTLDVMPFSDSTPGHLSKSGFFASQFGRFGTVAGHYEIDENGKVIAAGNPLLGLREVGPFGEFHARVTLGPHPSTVRFVLDASRAAKLYTLSTASSTVWTWRSAHESGGRLPVGWGCVLRRNGTAAGRSCAVEPMMTLEYAVGGLSLSGVAPAGAQSVRVLAGHVQPASGAPVTRAAASVSFDGGKTWHRAKLTGRNGAYVAAFTAPAGAKVSLRTSAADAAGGTITETIIDAYQAGS